MDHTHDFQPGPGGCDDNPGVWSLGGTTLSFLSTCECGAERHEKSYGSQRNPGEIDYYAITEAGDDPQDSTRICTACDIPVEDCPCGDPDAGVECSYCYAMATTEDHDGDPACRQCAADNAPDADETCEHALLDGGACRDCGETCSGTAMQGAMCVDTDCPIHGV